MKPGGIIICVTMSVGVSLPCTPKPKEVQKVVVALCHKRCIWQNICKRTVLNWCTVIARDNSTTLSVVVEELQYYGCVQIRKNKLVGHLDGIPVSACQGTVPPTGWSATHARHLRHRKKKHEKMSLLMTSH